MIGVGVTGLKRPDSCASWTCVGKVGEGLMWFSVCGAPLND